LKAFLAIARSSTAPDEVKHGALQRITSYPPERTVKAFYELFESPNWKVRYDGAMSILTIMQKVGTRSGTTPKEFLGKLPQKPDDGTGTGGQKFGLGEPSAYGLTLSQLPKELNARDAIMDALNSKSMGAQLTALGWFLSVGTKNDLRMLAKWETDKAPVPKCKEEDECGWDRPGCPVPKPGGKPDEGEWKSVTTVGEYVRYCVKPQIELRAKQGTSEGGPTPETPK
jgi:hypothetical protein